jgi:UDP-N-acetylenolpyruvoylglucosamine reductase
MTVQPGATADDVVQLMSLVKQQVRDTMGIQLRDAISYLGM